MDEMSVTSSYLTTAIVSLVVSIGGATIANATPASVREDLREAILFEGHACAEVVEADDQAAADYVAVCRDGQRYRLHVTPGGRLVITDLQRPEDGGAEPAGAHASLVKNMLTAVIHIGDVTCGTVVTVITLSPREHLATCSNRKQYRVGTAANGEVTVDEQ